MSIKELQKYTYISKYARYNSAKKRRETWEEACDRVLEMHIEKFPEVREELEWAFDQVKQKRVLGSQRALQFGGIGVKRCNARMYNCTVSFCDRLRFFQECFWLLLCGSGTGFSVQKHHIAKLPPFSQLRLIQRDGVAQMLPYKSYVISDSIEGWADALGILLSSYFEDPAFSEYANCFVEFDYHLIRPEGSLLSSSSGKAPGAEPLRRALEIIRRLLDERIDEGYTRLRPIDAYDIVMHASDAVLSGGVRRSATICIFSFDDEKMIKAKTGNWFRENPQRGRSNNSALLLRSKTSKEDFLNLISSVRQWGEPGFYWSDSTEQLPNPSLRAGTLVVTDGGILPIEQLEDKNFMVKNLRGEWANAKCRLSRKDADLVKITFNTGTSVVATPEHKWPIYNKRRMSYIKKQTSELEAGNVLPTLFQTNLFDGEIGDYEEGFLCGWLLTDGWITRRKDNGKMQYGFICSAKDAKAGIKDYLSDIIENKTGSPVHWTSRRRNEGEEWFETNLQRSGLHELFVGLGIGDTKKLGLPKNIWSGSEPFRKGFMNAIFSADGCVNESKFGYKTISISNKHPEFVYQLRELLGFYGIQTRIYKRSIDGSKSKFPNGKIYNKIYTIYTLNLANCVSAIHFANTFSLMADYKNESLSSLSNDTQHAPANGFVRIKKIETLEIKEDVWDISVYDDTHCFQLSSCITGNCVEIGMWPVDIDTLSSGWQQCNLCEVNGKKCKTAEDFEVAARAAAIIGTVQAGYTSFPYLGDTTEKIVRREALLGVSITGMMDNPDILFDPKLQEVVATVVKNTNAEIAGKIGINLAARCTCVKPAGTTSCILGTSSGIHPHHAKRYFRRVQANRTEAPFQHFANINPMAVEDSVWSANKKDAVITFCVEVESGAKIRNQMGAVDLLEYVKTTQKNWVMSGKRIELCTQPWLTHNVSNTITVREDEWDEVAEFIYENREYFAGISLLPASGDKDYPQAPFTTVHLPTEIVVMYGKGSLFASGLIVDGLAAFDNNLWTACDAATDLYVLSLNDSSPECMSKYEEQVDWVRRAKQFSERYFDGNIKVMTYCLKDVSNYHLWETLQREYRDVDYIDLFEEQDDTKPLESLACAGGSCLI